MALQYTYPFEGTNNTEITDETGVTKILSQRMIAEHNGSGYMKADDDQGGSGPSVYTFTDATNDEGEFRVQVGTATGYAISFLAKVEDANNFVGLRLKNPVEIWKRVGGTGSVVFTSSVTTVANDIIGLKWTKSGSDTSFQIVRNGSNEGAAQTITNADVAQAEKTMGLEVQTAANANLAAYFEAHTLSTDPVFDTTTGDRIFEFGDSSTIPAPTVDLQGETLTAWSLQSEDLTDYPGVTFTIDSTTGTITYSIPALNNNTALQALNSSSHSVTRRCTTSGGFTDETFTISVNIGSTTVQVTPGIVIKQWSTTTARAAGQQTGFTLSDEDLETYTVQAGGPPPSAGPDPVNTNADAATVQLLDDLYTYMDSDKCLLGQFRRGNFTEYEDWFTAVSKYPAIIQMDLQAHKQYAGGEQDLADFLEARHTDGSIVMVMWHWGSPKTSSTDYGNSNTAKDFMSEAEFLQCSTPGNTLYNNTIAHIDFACETLDYLQTAGVPIIFRPLHEMDSIAWWWGRRNPAHFRQLYELVYNRVTITNGLNNILWMWGGARRTANQPYTQDPADYMDHRYHDLIAWDHYPTSRTDPDVATRHAAIVAAAQGKPVGLAEFGTLPTKAIVDGMAPLCMLTAWNGAEPGVGLNYGNTAADWNEFINDVGDDYYTRDDL